MYYLTFELIFKSKDLLLPELQKIELGNRNYDVLIQRDNHKNWPFIEKGKYDTEFLKMAENDFRLTIKGKSKVYKKNDYVVISPNVSHEGQALTDCKLMDVFSPVREDYM